MSAPCLHVALAQHFNGAVYVWELDQPHGLPQPSIFGCVVQLLLAAAFPSLDSYAVPSPWREDVIWAIEVISQQ